MQDVFVPNAHLVDDPTIRQPGFTLPRQQWSLLNRFAPVKGIAESLERHHVLQTLICAPAVTPKRCPTSSNPALLRSWTVVCPSSTPLMMLLLPGWPTMGLNRIRKKNISKTYLNLPQSTSSSRSSLTTTMVVVARHCRPHSLTSNSNVHWCQPD